MTGTLLATTIGGIRSLKDGSLSITFETQEISPGKVGEVYALRNKVCYLYVSGNQITLPEQKIIDSMEPEMVGKSPSLRLRNVLFVAHGQNNEGYPDWDSFYKAKIESFINIIKNNLL
jgi:hypothetical protein